MHISSVENVIFPEHSSNRTHRIEIHEFIAGLRRIQIAYEQHNPDAARLANKLKDQYVAEIARLAVTAGRLWINGQDEGSDRIEKRTTKLQKRHKIIVDIIKQNESVVLYPDGAHGGPTPETALKSRQNMGQDVIHNLWRLGHLDAARVYTARAIARLFEALFTSAMSARSSMLSLPKGKSSTYRQPDISQSIADEHHHVYKPWYRRAQKLSNCNPDLTLDICVDGLSVQSARIRRRLGYPKALSQLQATLRLYAVIKQEHRRR